MQISYLADHPEFIETLAPGVFEHWRSILTQETLEARVAKFQAHLNRDILPIAWVAHSKSQVFGTAALRAYDFPGREDLTPWLGGVYVAPQFRARGISAALCTAVEHKAKTLLETPILVAYKVRKTEHGGAKKGAGFWGKKAEAKHQSSRTRRKQAAKEIQSRLLEGETHKHEKAI